ncbi:hypothetical protein HMPREF1316_2522 [Olsenella profusa F0195]|uniref:Uncharacterized protein n=1 Tax=Olsenella profusa F0195 TaxID=1125712 RepID=U2VBG1_9ACTN|nr:hypothetical protein HMPREF1316_2522 [Olsenella profusa F0195]
MPLPHPALPDDAPEEAHRTEPAHGRDHHGPAGHRGDNDAHRGGGDGEGDERPVRRPGQPGVARERQQQGAARRERCAEREEGGTYARLRRRVARRPARERQAPYVYSHPSEDHPQDGERDPSEGEAPPRPPPAGAVPGAVSPSVPVPHGKHPLPSSGPSPWRHHQPSAAGGAEGQEAPDTPT